MHAAALALATGLALFAASACTPKKEADAAAGKKPATAVQTSTASVSGTAGGTATSSLGSVEVPPGALDGANYKLKFSPVSDRTGLEKFDAVILSEPVRIDATDEESGATLSVAAKAFKVTLPLSAAVSAQLASASPAEREARKSQLFVLAKLSDPSKPVVAFPPELLALTKVNEGFGVEFSSIYFGATYFVIESATQPEGTVDYRVATAAEIPPSPAISAREPVFVEGGASITIHGSAFAEPTSIAERRSDGSLRHVAITYADPTTLKFVMPVDTPIGLRHFEVKIGALTQVVSFVVTGAAGDFPVFIGSREAICADRSYYDADGALTTGLRPCGEVADPPECSTDGERLCRTTANFVPVNGAKARPENIRAGRTIAGVAGAYPSADVPLAGASPQTPDLSKFSEATPGVTYEWFDSLGRRLTGEISANAQLVPGAAAVSLPDGLYKAVSVDGSSNLIPANIRAGVEIYGVTGTYPSESAPLAGATATTDLEQATFDARLKAAAEFEWFDGTGMRHVASGSTRLTAGNIRDDITIFGTTGTLEPATRKRCKNNARTALYNNTTAPAQAGLDAYDTIDDANGGAAGLPTGKPFGDDFACGAEIWTALGTDSSVSAGNCNDSADECVYQDTNSGLMWSEASDNLDFSAISGAAWPCGGGAGTCSGNINIGTRRGGTYAAGAQMVWFDAAYACSELAFGGFSDWRLPTQKELLQAYVDGIRSIEGSTFLPSAAAMWAASSHRGPGPNFFFYAITVHLGTGETTNVSFTRSQGTGRFLCVRS